MTVVIIPPNIGSDFDTWGSELNAALTTLENAINNLGPADVGLGNVPNLNLSDRNSPGYGSTQQPSSTISDFAEATRDAIGAALVAGSGITVTVDDAGDTITIALQSGIGVVLARFNTTTNTYPARASVTTNPQQPVIWIGPDNNKVTFGTGLAIDGVDVFWGQ